MLKEYHKKIIDDILFRSSPGGIEISDLRTIVNNYVTKFNYEYEIKSDAEISEYVKDKNTGYKVQKSNVNNIVFYK